MKREFQVLYRQRLPDRSEFGPPTVLDGVIARRAEDIKAVLENSGLLVLSVEEVRAVVDWSKPNFDRDEAAAFLCWKPGSLSNNLGGGEIPMSNAGSIIFPRVLLERHVAEKLNPAGKRLLDEESRKAA